MFPGAVADRDAAEYVLVGAPLDVSTSFRPGTRFGPRRVRLFSEPFDDYDRATGRRFTELGVHDRGDIHAWDDAAEYVEYLSGVLSDVVRDGAVPLLVGGEHTVSLAGVRAVEPGTFVCLDAHLDLRREYDGNPWSHATITRRALSTADRAIILGARTGSEGEWERAARDDVTVVPPADVPGWIEDAARGAAGLDDAGPVYLSVDVDVADPGFTPGTGTMEPFGLAPWTLRDAVRTVAPLAAGFDVVEVNDRDDGQTAALAAKLLREFVYRHAAAE